jgi:hypothetical protein
MHGICGRKKDETGFGQNIWKGETTKNGNKMVLKEFHPRIELRIPQLEVGRGQERSTR